MTEDEFDVAWRRTKEKVLKASQDRQDMRETAERIKKGIEGAYPVAIPEKYEFRRDSYEGNYSLYNPETKELISFSAVWGGGLVD